MKTNQGVPSVSSLTVHGQTNHRAADMLRSLVSILAQQDSRRGFVVNIIIATNRTDYLPCNIIHPISDFELQRFNFWLAHKIFTSGTGTMNFPPPAIHFSWRFRISGRKFQHHTTA